VVNGAGDKGGMNHSCTVLKIEEETGAIKSPGSGRN
jgi:hypothetical protein